MSVKDCGKHEECCRRKYYRKVCGVLAVVLLVVLFIILIVWLVLRPTKPRFYLQDVTVLCLNVTAPSYLTTTMQVTLVARNPNSKVGVYYDKADAFAEYKNQQVTVPTALPVVYQDALGVSVWSPFLSGSDVPLAPYLALALTQDETAGYVLVNVRVDGWIRWKVGSWISGHYHLMVNCPALLTVNGGRGSYGSNSGGGDGYFHFQQAAACTVDV